MKPNSEGALCLFGASLDTGNLGVSALGLSILYGVHRWAPNITMIVYGFGRGEKVCSRQLGDKAIRFIHCGAYHTRRYYRPESLFNIWVSAHAGWNRNAALEHIRRAEAVLDITGGDSFTDIYGRKRFTAATLGKRIVLGLEKPLVLLPQTYGPFVSKHRRQIASKIVRKCTGAWARDARSFIALQELLGDAYDASRHKSGVDVAFGLPCMEPEAELPSCIRDLLEDHSTPLVGLNVSGLLMNRPEKASRDFQLKADYKTAIIGLVKWLFRHTDARILLVPHVITPPGHYESDIEACRHVFEVAAPHANGRVAVLPSMEDPCKLKWVIGKCSWFCGTRMHATIAALSSGVPASAISYSPKTLGVFETCDQGEHVADPRELETEALLERLVWSWNNRESAQRSLAAALPRVARLCRSQMEELVAMCRFRRHAS